MSMLNQLCQLKPPLSRFAQLIADIESVLLNFLQELQRFHPERLAEGIVIMMQGRLVAAKDHILHEA